MTSEAQTGAPGFWYEDSGATGIDVLNALRRLRTAENSAQRRVRDALGIGDNALTALRVLIDAARNDRAVNARQLAVSLDITSASVTGLVDRLVRNGYVERRPDPTDRRGVLLTATGSAMRTALPFVESLDRAVAAVAETLSAESAGIIRRFLDETTIALESSESLSELGDEARFLDSRG